MGKPGRRKGHLAMPGPSAGHAGAALDPKDPQDLVFRISMNAEIKTPATAQPDRDFRNALGSFGTGVAVVTTCAPDGTLHGLTVNSFSAVSLQPRLVLWSQSLRTPSHAVFDAATHYAINLLAADQVELSRRFARSAPDKFAGLEVARGLGGIPLLAGAVATFECLATARHPGGDHVIHVGEVLRYAYSDGTPLLFVRGRYQTGRDLEANPRPDTDLEAAWGGLS